MADYDHIFLSTTVGARPQFLDRFLRYYKGLGIHRFLVTLQIVNKDDPVFKHAMDILDEHNLYPATIWEGCFRETKKMQEERALTNLMCEKNAVGCSSPPQSAHFISSIYSPPL